MKRTIMASTGSVPSTVIAPIILLAVFWCLAIPWSVSGGVHFPATVAWAAPSTASSKNLQRHQNTYAERKSSAVFATAYTTENPLLEHEINNDEDVAGELYTNDNGVDFPFLGRRGFQEQGITTPGTITANVGEATMECNQAKELDNVQDVFEDYYDDVKPDGYYFCAKTAPKDLYCYCGVASTCRSFNDPWGRNIGECGCCTQWVYIVFGIFMAVVGMVFFCGMFACLCHGTWLYDGHPRPIAPMLPQRTAPVIAPASFPLPANAFRGYRSTDFISGDEQPANSTRQSPRNADERPQSPTAMTSQRRGNNSNTASRQIPPSAAAAASQPREEADDDLELEPLPRQRHSQSPAAAASSSSGGVIDSHAPPPPPIPSGQDTPNTSGGRGASARPSTGGSVATPDGESGWVYDSDSNQLAEGSSVVATQQRRTAAPPNAKRSSQQQQDPQVTYSPSSHEERHHHPVSPNSDHGRPQREQSGSFSAATLPVASPLTAPPTATASRHRDTRDFVNFEDDSML